MVMAMVESDGDGGSDGDGWWSMSLFSRKRVFQNRMVAILKNKQGDASLSEASRFGDGILVKLILTNIEILYDNLPY